MFNLFSWLCVCLVSCTIAGSNEKFTYFKRIVDEINSSNASWKAGFHDDPEHAEYLLERPLGARWDLDTLSEIPCITYDDYSDIPESFDGREHWKDCPSFRHISNQGECRSSWAVSSAGTLSDRMCIFTSGARNEQLSAEELLWCCNDEDPDCGEASCASGFGDPFKAWGFFHYHGLVSGGDYGSNEGCQPYSIPPNHTTTGEENTNLTCQKKCTNKNYRGSFAKDHYRSGPAVRMCSNKDAQKSIMTDGSITATFDMYEDFRMYRKGVYHHTAGKSVDDESHSVRVVGWGVEDNEDYWLVANSWGPKWGDNGWFKMRRGKNDCGFEMLFVAGSRPLLT